MQLRIVTFCAIGARFDDRVAGDQRVLRQMLKIAHFDIDISEINKVKSVDWYHVVISKKI